MSPQDDQLALTRPRSPLHRMLSVSVPESPTPAAGVPLRGPRRVLSPSTPTHSPIFPEQSTSLSTLEAAFQTPKSAKRTRSDPEFYESITRTPQVTKELPLDRQRLPLLAMLTQTYPKGTSIDTIMEEARATLESEVFEDTEPETDGDQPPIQPAALHSVSVFAKLLRRTKPMPSEPPRKKVKPMDDRGTVTLMVLLTLDSSQRESGAS